MVDHELFLVSINDENKIFMYLQNDYSISDLTNEWALGKAMWCQILMKFS